MIDRFGQVRRRILSTAADFSARLTTWVFHSLRRLEGSGARTVLSGRRADIRKRLDVWLDEVLREETLPAGLDAELLSELETERDESARAVDLYSLWAAMCELSHEVKLQGRAFQRLRDAVEGIGEVPAGPAADRRLIELLLEIGAGLRRGLESVRAADGREETISAIEAGYLMGLDRLDEELERLGLQELECAGRPFDPTRMRAVDVEERSDCAEGTVLDVYRTGYTLGGRVFREAEVKVARRQGGGK
ncbi:MAG: nucleotide exchange factor GrpE [Deltaproteobacteria bacterium]|nr:nucleotide exchange factor GrpE [Deltaproteobacteria bacterium]